MELGGTAPVDNDSTMAETDDDNFEKQFIHYAMIIIVKIYVFFFLVPKREKARVIRTHTHYKCYGGTFYANSRTQKFCG